MGTLTIGLLAAPLAAEAQQAAKSARSVIWRPARLRHGPAALEAFLQGLRELDYVEGQNIAIEYRFGRGQPRRLPAFAAELVRLKVDIIVASAPPASLAAKQATRTIPIVMRVATTRWARARREPRTARRKCHRALHRIGRDRAASGWNSSGRSSEALARRRARGIRQLGEP